MNTELRNLIFKNENRYYDLKFNQLRVMQIKGESGIGKSLFCSDLKIKKNIDTNFKNIVVFDFENSDMLNLVKDFSLYDYVVFDNADLYLTDELCSIIESNILSDSKTHWIIIGRNSFSCVLSLGCIGVLERKTKGIKHYFCVNYSIKS